MPNELKFEVKGLSALDNELQKLDDRAQKRVKRKALRAGAKPVLNKAKLLVPVRTGTLKKSLGIQIEKIGNDIQAFVLARKGKKQKNDGWYAHLVEFEVSAHSVSSGDNKSSNKQSGRQHPGTEAQPFLRPALEEESEAVINEIARVLAEELIKEANKI